MTESAKTPLGLDTVKAALATYPPEQPCKIIVNYRFNRNQEWSVTLSDLIQIQAPLIAFLAENGGEIASGAGKVAMTLYGPPAMFQKLLEQPELIAPLKIIETYYELKTNI